MAGTARSRSAGGQAPAGPVLLISGANPLVAQAQGPVARRPRRTRAVARSTSWRLLRASGRAQLGFEDGKPLVRSATLELPRIEMPAAYTSFLQIALAATDFGTLDTSGTLARAHRGRRRRAAPGRRRSRWPATGSDTRGRL